MKTYTKPFISAEITRHPDFGGGTIVADMPDTPNNRVACIRVIAEWTQTFEVWGGEVVECTKPAYLS